MIGLQTEDVIHFRSQLWVVMTISRTITDKVKLAPVDRGQDSFELSSDSAAEWFGIEEVEKHARFVGYFKATESV